MKKYCIYGNPTIDLIKLRNQPEYISHGGGSFYSALPLIEKNIDVEVYAVYSDLLVEHPISKYIVKQQYSSRVNVFRLEYENDTRQISIIDTAPPIHPWNTHSDLCYSIVDPVLGEVTIPVLKAIQVKSILIAVDLQGYLRKLRDNKIIIEQTPESIQVLELSDIVHLDIEEYHALLKEQGGIASIRKHLKGVMVVTIRPNKSIIIQSREERFRILEIQEDFIAIDKTGAGDYFLSQLFYYYIESNDVEEAIYKAHEYTTLWLKKRSIKPPHRTHYRSCNSRFPHLLKNTMYTRDLLN